jgi:hypothetical protein
VVLAVLLTVASAYVLPDWRLAIMVGLGVLRLFTAYYKRRG